MLGWLLTPEALIAMVTLTVLELVLGIDNVAFIAILASRLPLHQQDRARTIGLPLAAFARIAGSFNAYHLASNHARDIADLCNCVVLAEYCLTDQFTT
jgi:predicted tellurium resistance membrane protein TerC